MRAPAPREAADVRLRAGSPTRRHSDDPRTPRSGRVGAEDLVADGLPLLCGSRGLRLLELGGDRASTPVGADRCRERPRHLRHVHGAPRRRPPLPQHDRLGERNARPGGDGVRVAGHGVSGVVVHPPRTPPLGQRPCTRPRQLRELRDGVADAPALAVHGRSLRGLLHPTPKRSPARRGRRDLAVHGLHRRPHRHDRSSPARSGFSSSST